MLPYIFYQLTEMILVTKKNTLFKNTIYKAMLSFVNIVVPLIIGPYIIRLLDVDLYGTYNKVFSIFQVFLAFASFGVYNFGVREISKIRNDKEKVSTFFSNLFLISLISNLIIILIYILFVIFTANGIEKSIYFVFLIQFAANIVYVEFVNEALENYKFIALKSVIVKILYFFGLLLLVTKSDQIVLYAIIVSLTVFLNNFVSFIYAKKHIKFSFKNIKFKKYLKPLFAVLIITNVDLLFSQLDRVMLGSYVSDVSVTLYYIPYYVVSTLVSIPYAVIFVSIPRLSYVVQNESKETYENTLANVISSLLFIIIPLCFGILVLAEEIIFIYAGEKYMLAVIPLIVACVGRIFVCLESVMNHLVMYPNNKENRILKVSLTCGLLNLSLNFLLVFLGILEPATAMITTAISEFGVFIWHYIYAVRVMKIKVAIFNKNNFKYLLLSILFIPLSLIIRWLNFGFVWTIVLIVIGCVLLYGCILLKTKDNNLIFILNKFKKVGRLNG